MNILGGKGDKLHLGGFTDLDIEGVSHNVWNFMMVWKLARCIIMIISFSD